MGGLLNYFHLDEGEAVLYICIMNCEISQLYRNRVYLHPRLASFLNGLKTVMVEATPYIYTEGIGQRGSG